MKRYHHEKFDKLPSRSLRTPASIPKKRVLLEAHRFSIFITSSLPFSIVTVSPSFCTSTLFTFLNPPLRAFACYRPPLASHLVLAKFEVQVFSFIHSRAQPLHIHFAPPCLFPPLACFAPYGGRLVLPSLHLLLRSEL